jgi:hypothetical protein
LESARYSGDLVGEQRDAEGKTFRLFKVGWLSLSGKQYIAVILYYAHSSSGSEKPVKYQGTVGFHKGLGFGTQVASLE